MSAYSLGQSARKISDVDADAPIVKMRTAAEAKLTAKQQKAQMKEAYDSMSSVFESSLELMQKDLPELEYYQVDVCEEDGDLLASIVAGDK